MKRPTMVAAAVAGVFVVVVGLLLAQAGGGGGAASEPSGEGATAVSEAALGSDPRILGERGSSGVTFVEFLDFECEACGAAYPIVEDLRKEYAGEVTFGIRYFPIPSHFNAERAARAVESAARQGKLTEMYSLMYTNQKDWAEQQEPKDDVFRSYAESLGLDMEQYEADYSSPEIAERVQRDVQAGTEMGVQGTPTFFVNGELFQPETVEDFSTALEEALTESGSS